MQEVRHQLHEGATNLRCSAINREVRADAVHGLLCGARNEALWGPKAGNFAVSCAGAQTERRGGAGLGTRRVIRYVGHDGVTSREEPQLEAKRRLVVQQVLPPVARHELGQNHQDGPIRCLAL